MDIVENLEKIFGNLSPEEIAFKYVLGESPIQSTLEGVSYDSLKGYCDNFSGTDTFDALLSYFVKIDSRNEVEVKLYFAEKKRWLDAVQFYQVIFLSEFYKKYIETDSKLVSQIQVFVYENENKLLWEHGELVFNGKRELFFYLNERESKYVILQVGSDILGQDEDENTYNINGIERSLKKININELKKSEYW